MRRRGIEITREELVLISLGILQDRSPCEDNVSDISDLPDLLGIDRTTLLRYFGNLSNMELIKKLGRRPFRIRLSETGKKRYTKIMEGLKGIYLDHNKYSIERKVKLDYFIKALTPIDEFNVYFSTNFSDEEFDTIGGLVIQAFGHMPGRNEVITLDGFEFKVINADQRKIHSLRMQPVGR